MPYRAYPYDKSPRTPKPQPQRRKRGPLTPAKPCVVINAETRRPVFFTKYIGGKFSFGETGGRDFTIFPSRIKAKAALWHICEWLKSRGEKDTYEVVRYEQN